MLCLTFGDSFENLNNYFFSSNDNNDNYVLRDMNSFRKNFSYLERSEVNINHRTADIKLADMQLWFSW